MDAAAVHLGLPFGWITQDHSTLEPTYPISTGLLSPWEFVTQLEALPMIANYAILFTATYLLASIPRLVASADHAP